MKNKVILSICIPTYNRCNYLEETILSIVNQKKFQETNDVEIVISDNCSEDNTRDVCERYIQIYGNKIRYYRNNENIKDNNFEKVLSLGKGKFLKLNNDTLIHYEDTLEKIIETINLAILNKDIIFFSNGALNNLKQFHCDDLNSFVKKVSFYSTWVVCFGIWKSDFDSIDNFSLNAGLQLVQTDVLFRLISINRPVLIENDRIFHVANLTSKGGYNLYQVFVTNYIELLDEYRKKDKISWVTLFNEKSKLLINFLIPWKITLLTDRSKYTFDQKGALLIVFKKYRLHPVFYIGAIYFVLKFVKYYLMQFIKAISIQKKLKRN